MGVINSLDLQEALEARMTNRYFLKRMKVQKNHMESFLRDIDIAGHAARIARQDTITWKGVIDEMKSGLDLLCPEPAVGWRQYCYSDRKSLPKPAPREPLRSQPIWQGAEPI